MVKVYDREKKEYIEEVQYGHNKLKFLYENRCFNLQFPYSELKRRSQNEIMNKLF